jgi:hypothetical protein
MSYKCFLYRKVDGKVESCLFYNEEEAGKALESGEWSDTPAVFVNTVEEIPLEHRQAIKEAAMDMATDANVLANCDKMENIETLKHAYERLTGKPMHKRIKTIEGARKACHKLLGEIDGNSAGIH